jgi:hypothetical protein
MSLAGLGVIAIWNDIAEGKLDEFLNWHNVEHIPERIGIPGFLRARRYRACSSGPQFFQLYELDSPNALTGADYTLRLNSPTEWTRRLSPIFQNSSRSLCKVAFSQGRGQGGCLATIRFEIEGDERETREHRRRLAVEVLPAVAENFQIAGVHLCVADLGASRVETAEKQGRATQAKVPGNMIMVEGATDPGALEAICNSALSAAALRASRPPLLDLYVLQFSRCKLPWSVG